MNGSADKAKLNRPWNLAWIGERTLRGRRNFKKWNVIFIEPVKLHSIEKM
jgi:hypothetical protein